MESWQDLSPFDAGKFLNHDCLGSILIPTRHLFIILCSIKGLSIRTAARLWLIYIIMLPILYCYAYHAVS